MKKTLYTAFLLTSAVTVAAANSTEVRIANLEAAIAELKQQAEQEKTQKAKDGKAVRIPGTAQTVELIFRPTLNTIADFGQRGDDAFGLGSIPLKDVDVQHRGRGGFSMSPGATRLGLRTNHDTAKGPVKTMFEIDFLGRTSRIQPRLRHAYITHNQFLAGHTNTLFYDGDTTGDITDMSGMMGKPVRQGQLRIAQKVGAFDGAFSLERPFTDVMYKATSSTSTTYSSSGTAVGSETPTSTEGITTRGSQFSQPAVPDAVMSVKYNTAWGHIGGRGVIRDLRVKYISGTTAPGNTTYRASKTGHGLGAFASAKVCEKARLFGQYNVGRGLGRYLPDIGGYSAYVDPTTQTFDLIRVNHYLTGFEWKWTPEIRSNIIYNNYHLTLSKNMPSSILGWNKNLRQAVVNTFFKPLPNTDLGVEYMYGERESQQGGSTNRSYKGTSHRVQMVMMYNF